MKKKRSRGTKYPSMSPNPKGDLYFPRSSIPRPVYRDIQENPRFFGVKKKKPHVMRRARR